MLLHSGRMQGDYPDNYFLSVIDYLCWAGKLNHCSLCDSVIHKLNSPTYFALINMRHKTCTAAN